MIIEISTPDPPVVEIVVPNPPTVDVIFPEPSSFTVTAIPGSPGPTGPPGPSGTIVHVGSTPPLDPSVNDLWVDTT